ncbi:MAG: DegT/DnrJ/EryC1/StrS family aminotransferase [Bacteroidia bacterium]|nr:DegT/DnrJ/EryC1/StrS family aminotransferase [Bacteroidia bacterium]
MEKLRMVDLDGQYKKIKGEIDKAILDVVESTAYINGPEVHSFQKDLENYLNVKHVIPVANGTDALQVAMMALGFKPGDEIITASFTYVATAEVIALLQLKPVLVDVDPLDFCIDPEAVERAITPKTVGIVPVHLFGQCANMDKIMKIAEKHNLKVIEDTAQAIGSDYIRDNGQKVKAGTIGTIGATSFFPSKNLGCYGDGGALYTNDDDLALKCRSTANHGQSSRRYYHDDIGVNSRLDSIQAAILRIKLKNLDNYAAARNKAASYYDKVLGDHPKLKIPVRNSWSKHVFHQYTLQLDGVNRADLMTHLESKGIPSMIYYPVPLHFQKAYRDDRYNAGDFPVTEKLCDTVFSLPMHTELSEEQLKYITDNVLQFIN